MMTTATLVKRDGEWWFRTDDAVYIPTAVVPPPRLAIAPTLRSLRRRPTRNTLRCVVERARQHGQAGGSGCGQGVGCLHAGGLEGGDRAPLPADPSCKHREKVVS